MAASLSSVPDRPARLLIAGCLAAAVALQVAREQTVVTSDAPAPVLWLQSPETARRLMLGFTDLAADMYWIRAVVHYGSERRSTATTGRYALLYPLLDFTTSLDPRFDVATRLGAIFLSEGYPGGPGRPDQALALLEKGLRQDPERWQYRHDMGFVYYWWLKDYPEAARQFELAGQMPGAPVWLRTLAAVTLTKGGGRAGARQLWQELHATADTDWLRNLAGLRLQQLMALDDLDALRGVVAAFRARAGRAPRDWSEVVRAGMLSAVPVDPTGVPYVLEADADVTLDPKSALLPLPVIEGTA